MSERVDLQEFIGAFVAEVEELIAAANALLLEIERANAAGQTRPRAVRDLFRALHTVKGLAGMIGVEPIVDIAHALETLLRTADRAGGGLRAAAVDVSLQGVAAIGERVRAVAEQRDPAPAPQVLLAAIAAVDSGDDPVAAPPPPVATEWDASLAAGERKQLGDALAEGRRAWTVAFVPSEGNAARGVTIATVRAKLDALGDVLKVLPRSTPGAPTSIAFDILLVSDAAPAAIADAAATAEAALRALALPRVAEPVAVAAAAAAGAAAAAAADAGAAEPDLRELHDAPAAIGRALVRVDLARLDELQDQLSKLMVSRLALEREVAALAAQAIDVRRLREVVELQRRQIRALGRAILHARMVRVADVMEPLSLLVRRLARAANKQVRLELDARDAEIDKAVADRLLPALIHLVRNAVDHAIEPPAERTARGKPETGVIAVTTTEVGGRVEIVVRDDGRGIDRDAVARRAGRAIANDRELLAVLTAPGFSTREVATTTSGRGLGMDIVKRIAVDVLSGELTIASERDVGTAFTLRVPLTISVVEVFLFECGAHSFVVPVSSIEEIFELSGEQAGEIAQPPRGAGAGPTVRMLERRGHAVPLLSLGAVLALDRDRDAAPPTALARKAMITLRSGEPVAFAVDRMIGRYEVVIRPIEDPLVRVPGIAGATDLGTGKPTLVLDLRALDLKAREHRA